MDLNRQLAESRQETDSITSSSSQRFVQKRDSLPRPKVGLGASEADWGLFAAQWSRYVAGSHMTDEQQVHQLWAACSDDLQRAMHDGGQGRISDPGTLMENIRLIAVRKLNNLVNICEFRSMSQYSSEKCTAFGTHLNGQASICDMYTSCNECEAQVSFKEDMILYQFICGLKDTQIQSKILEASAQVEGGKLSLPRTLKLAESFEMSRNSQDQMNKGTVWKLSDHQKSKRTGQQTSEERHRQTSLHRYLCICGAGGHKIQSPSQHGY